MPTLGMDLVLATLVPVFVGSLSIIHELRGGTRDLGGSLRIAAAIWLGIGLGTLTAMALASPRCAM